MTPRGAARGLGQRLPKERPPPPQPGKARPRAAATAATGHAHWRGSGPQPRQEAPALGGSPCCQLESGGAGAPAQGGSASPRAPGRPHTYPSVTSARAPGVCVSCRSRSEWAVVLRTARLRGCDASGRRSLGARRGVRSAGDRGDCQRGSGPHPPPPACPAPTAARSRAGRGGVAQEPAARGARTALTPAAPRQAGARSSMVGSERDEPPVLHRPQR